MGFERAETHNMTGRNEEHKRPNNCESLLAALDFGE